MEKTKLVRVDVKVWEQLTEIKGSATYSKFIGHLIEFFMTKK